MYRFYIPVLALLMSLPACTTPQASYEDVKTLVADAIRYEMEDKAIPGFGIVLVEDQDIVWAEGFGEERPGVEASEETVYRVGSVSKLFTDIGIMQLVEEGTLDLDAPITTYLPEFTPENPFGGAITLRQLMSHRSGLIREPLVGNYFETTEPSLEATVQSLIPTTLVFEPETKIKYSNGGIAVVGYVLERLKEQPFTEYLQKAVLEPMGLSNSAFYLAPGIEERLATAYMWTLDGRQFDAPGFQLGMSPAGSMYAPVTDLGQFMTVLFNGGRGPEGPVLQPETLELMWTPQYGQDKTSGFGIGFSISEQDGFRRVGHGGAIYGFSTQLFALPELKLGVAAVSTVDGTNTIAARISQYALSLMLAMREGKPLPEYPRTKKVAEEMTQAAQGVYSSGDQTLVVYEADGALRLAYGGINGRLKADGDDWIVDDRFSYGPRITFGADTLFINELAFVKEEPSRPAPAPEEWAGLIGEYGWDHNTLYILENEGRLVALIEWFFRYELTDLGNAHFAFPDYGLYHDEVLVFNRDENGVASQVRLEGGTVFERRVIEGNEGSTYQINLVRPVDVLKSEALAAIPPEQPGEFREPELVELAAIDPTIHLDIRYATTKNFMGSIFYDEPRAFLQKPAAEALLRVHQALQEKGYGLQVYDAYRPWYVTKMFWDATPEDQKIFVANPANGSRHNRGCAIDVTLYDLETGMPVETPSGYDEFSERAYALYPGGTGLERWHRELLRGVMEAEGFTVYNYEWWHFDYKDWREYPVMNVRFEDIDVL